MVLVTGVEPPPLGTIFQASRLVDPDSIDGFQTVNVLGLEPVSPWCG